MQAVTGCMRASVSHAATAQLECTGPTARVSQEGYAPHVQTMATAITIWDAVDCLLVCVSHAISILKECTCSTVLVAQLECAASTVAIW